jgi:hypothetical protein
LLLRLLSSLRFLDHFSCLLLLRLSSLALHLFVLVLWLLFR